MAELSRASDEKKNRRGKAASLFHGEEKRRKTKEKKKQEEGERVWGVLGTGRVVKSYKDLGGGGGIIGMGYVLRKKGKVLRGQRILYLRNLEE